MMVVLTCLRFDFLQKTGSDHWIPRRQDAQCKAPSARLRANGRMEKTNIQKKYKTYTLEMLKHTCVGFVWVILGHVVPTIFGSLICLIQVT
jgi:hypothetical protein